MHNFTHDSRLSRCKALQPGAAWIDRWDPVMKNPAGFVAINKTSVRRTVA